MPPALSLSIRHPKSGERTELVLGWTNRGWEIHDLEGNVTYADSDCLELMNLLADNNFAAPDLRAPMGYTWAEIDMEVEGAPADELDAGQIKRHQEVVDALARWIESTTASRPTGEVFQ